MLLTIKRIHVVMNLIIFSAFYAGLLWAVLCNAKFPEESDCFQHEDCIGELQFCGWSVCKDSSGWTQNCGICKNCSLCLCNSDAIDFVCPRNKCPKSPYKGINSLSGSWNILTSIAEPAIHKFNCFRRLTFSGSVFSDFQVVVSLADPGRADSPLPEHIQAAESVCPTFERSGHFQITGFSNYAILKLHILVARQGANMI